MVLKIRKILEGLSLRKRRKNNIKSSIWVLFNLRCLVNIQVKMLNMYLKRLELETKMSS